MKKILLSCFIFSLFAILYACGDIEDSTKTVYITPTGSKYHLSDCRTLGSNRISIEEGEAIKKGYSACDICKP